MDTEHQIRTAAESVQSGIQLARAEAIKRNTPVQFNFRTRTAWTICLQPAAPGDCPLPDNATTIQSRDETEGSSNVVTTLLTPNSNQVIFNNLGQVDGTAPSFNQVDWTSPALLDDFQIPFWSCSNAMGLI